MPANQVNNLISMTQISGAKISSVGAANIPDFKYDGASIVAKWNGYILYYIIFTK